MLVRIWKNQNSADGNVKWCSTLENCLPAPQRIKHKSYHVHACVLSHSAVSDSLKPHEPARFLPSMEFSRQEYCSGLPLPIPGDLLDPGMEPMSLCLLH